MRREGADRSSESRPILAPLSAIGLDVGGSGVQIARVEWLRSLPDPSTPTATDRDDAASRAAPVELHGTGTIALSPTPSHPAAFAEAAADALERLDLGGHLPLGVALPGYLDGERRRVLRLSHLPAFDGDDLASRLADRTGRRVTLDTDTNAGAVGESIAGAGVGHERVLYVSLGTGLGAALVRRGRPIRVSHHVVGHAAGIPIGAEHHSAESLLCAARIRRHSACGREPRAECLAADAGDVDARQVWNAFGADLGALLAVLVPFLRAEVVVVGGGLSGASHHFLDAARDALDERTTLPATPIVTAALRPLSGVFGMALLADEPRPRAPGPDR